jgi:hypothetical protein
LLKVYLIPRALSEVFRLIGDPPQANCIQVEVWDPLPVQSNFETKRPSPEPPGIAKPMPSII